MKKLKQMYRCIEELKYGNDKTTRCPTKTLGHDKQSGFTLVELVIVIAIVIILSVISVPIYRGYVDKSKMAEGYALLGSILSAQKAYYSEYGNFLRRQESSAKSSSGYETPYETVLGIDARGNKYFSLFVVGYNGSDGQEKKYFDARAMDAEGYWLMIQCNITKGSRYFYPYRGRWADVSDWLN